MTGRTILLGLLFLASALACVPKLTSDQAQPNPASQQQAPTTQPTPNIDATVEALVSKYVREEMAAIPTITPAPTATPMFLPALQPAPATSGMSSTQAESPEPLATPSSGSTSPLNSGSSPLPASIDLSAMVNRVKSGVVRINTSSGVGSGIIAETR